MRRSPLYDQHVARGAKFAEFGGWQMPLEYAGGGVVAEHKAVRSAVGVFDVSHLGKALVRGPGAAAYVDATLTNALDKIAPGKAQYTLACVESGGVQDDLILYLRGPEEVQLVPNAANTSGVVRRLADEAPNGVEVIDQHESYAILAVQGPQSPQVLARLGLPSDHAYMSFVDAEWDGTPLVVCRTGYTGERGYELLVPWEKAAHVWEALLAGPESAGEDGIEVVPCGLGARDTLRTEAGLPLHGQDLSVDITPLQARAGWAVGWDKPTFWGRAALLAERQAGPRRRLWGIRAHGRGIPRPGMTVSDADGTPVGAVTSGTFAPSLRTGVGLALLDAGLAPGAEVTVDIRGRAETFGVVKPPFITPHGG